MPNHLKRPHCKNSTDCSIEANIIDHLGAREHAAAILLDYSKTFDWHLKGRKQIVEIQQNPNGKLHILEVHTTLSAELCLRALYHVHKESEPFQKYGFSFLQYQIGTDNTLPTYLTTPFSKKPSYIDLNFTPSQTTSRIQQDQYVNSWNRSNHPPARDNPGRLQSHYCVHPMFHEPSLAYIYSD
ncbi:hypothetical protein J6590_052214 [Homalodisca vitripennis]|nr:hypothetical protein J6590_052214 [Homalodisca vitripennis]